MGAMIPGLPGIQRQLLARLLERHANEPGDEHLTWRIAQAYRALGDFRLAERYYRAVLSLRPDHAEARYFVAVLGGDGPETPLADLRFPSPPFLRFENFLEERAAAALWSAVEELLPQLHPSVVEEYGVVALNPDSRRSMSTHASRRIRDILLDPVLEAVARHDIVRRLGMRNMASIDRVQMSLIAYGDDDYFCPHRDAGHTEENRLRELTFVYHLFRTPKRFSGGDLCLFDAGLADGEVDKVNGLSLFEPLNNGLLFFPSHALHEVRPIRCASTDPLDGRFAIAGWALRSE